MSLDQAITRRTLGWLVLAGGGAAAVAVLAADGVRAGAFDGFGPAQRQALLACAAVTVFGLSLLPWPDTPLVGDVDVTGRAVVTLPAWVRWLALRLALVTALALLFQLVVYFHYAGSLLRFPYDYDQGEGFELYDTLLHTQGVWPYQDSQVFPFYTSIYPPLFHLITAPLVTAFGPQLWTGRLVSFLGSLLAAGAIAWAVARTPGRPLRSVTAATAALAAMAGLLFLGSNYTFAIGPLFRQHMTMVMFETVAIAVLATFSWSGPQPLRSRRMWTGLALLLCAGFSKQLALATVLAALTWLFLGSPRRAVLAGLAAAAVAGTLFAFINWRTDGWWSISIIEANINAFDIPQMLGFYQEWLTLHAVLAVAAFAYAGHELYRGQLSLYSVWFLFAFGNGVLSGKFGAGESYFVTATAAATILFGLGLRRLWRWAGVDQALGPARPEQARALALALVLAAPVLSLVQWRLTLHTYTEGPYAPVAALLGVSDNSGRGFYDSQGYTQLGPRPTAADHAAGDRIAALARAAEGPVFSEEAGFMFAAGKPVVTNAFPQLVMYQAGLFDPANEIAMLNERAFGLVILRAQFYPPPVLQAIGDNYTQAREIAMNGFRYLILEPR
jgi:hypothetical protein